MNYTITSNFFFYLLILFLPTQLGRHFFLSFSFVSGIRVDYLAPTIYATDILIFLIFVFWIASTKKFLISNFKFLINSKFLISKSLIIVLVLVLIIGILLSKSPQAGVYGFIKLLEFIFLGFYTARNIKRLNFGIVLFLFSIGIIFESFLAIFQYVNQGSIGGIFYFFGERTFNSQTPGIANASVNGELILRPYGTFSHPNVLAGYITIAIAMVISNFKFQISNFKKIIFLVSLVIGTVALFLTMSRIAILLWLFIVLMFGFIKIKKYLKNKFTIYYLLFTILIIGSILMFSPLRFRFTNINLSDESIVQRESLIQSSIEMIKNHPFLGVGQNNFLVNLPSYQTPHAPLFYLQPVHNIFILIATETGIVGFSFFVWFLIKTYRFINHKSYILILLTSVLTLGMFDHYFLTLQQGQLLFSFILGLCWSDFRKSK